MRRTAFMLYLFIGLLALLNPIPDAVSAPQATQGDSSIVEQAGNSPEESPHEAITMDSSRGEETKNIETWYHFYAKGRPVSDIIALVFFLGLLFVFEELRRTFFDSFRSRRLRKMDLINSPLEEVAQEIDRVPNTRLAKLISSLMTLHSSTGSLESIQNEIDLFIRNRQERFNSFRTRLDFLSDSAGALGLLGTVWGIFNAFESKDWRPENILPDIGFALVTTFIGIIASLILNLLSTEVSNYFNRKIALLQLRVDEFRKNLYRHHSEISGRSKKEYRSDIRDRSDVRNKEEEG